ncbi:MAG TPA: S8 family serine peptidase, partial [bacterium]|nr:S8 family serine peptidase [bacterium]
MNKWDHLLSIALLGFLFVSQVYSADRGSKPIRLNGIEIDIPTLAETQPFHPQSVENASLCHVLIQFRQPTSPREREKIEQTGICFLHYVPNNTYFISGPVDALNALRRDTRVVGVIPIPSEAKIDTGIRERIGEGEAPAERQVSGKRPSSPPKIGGDTEGVDITQPESQATETVKVLFYPETSFNDSRRTLLAHSAILEATRTGFDFRQTFNSVTLPVDQIRSLAEEDSVFLITEIDPPAKPANLDAQDTSNVDEIQPGGIAGYNLDGTGVTVGMWDSGFIRFTHEQVIGRATQEDWNSAPYFNAHSCHVAGIIAGNGKGNAQAEGMAPNATLLCWETTNDLNEIDTNAHRISVSNHSYVSGISPVQTGNTGRTVATSNYNGVYSSQTQAFDRLAADHNLIMVMAAGNARKTSGIDGYDSLPSGTAKNVITVGAIHDRIEEPPIPDDSSMTDFSSWGPTDDGRIKPDVVANGLGLLSMGPNSDNDYYTNSGTSMSTPVVSGIAACLVQQYRRYFAGNDPEAATMK